MYKYIFLALALISIQSFAYENSILTIDRALPNNLTLAFPNESNIKPKSSDFDVVNYVLMSNGAGERWAIITLTNLSTGSRTFESGHLMATFADGARQIAEEFKLIFKPNETQSITLTFGKNKFPILSINTRSGIITNQQ